MRRICFAFAALALCAPAASGQTTPAQRTQVAAADTIIYEVTSWGRVTYHLELHRSGRLRAWRHDFNSGARLEERDEQRAPAAYTEALATLAPLSPAPTLDCSSAPTDGPSGHYLWHNAAGQQAFTIYYGCYSARPRPAANQAAFDVEERFFALTAPVVAAAP